MRENISLPENLCRLSRVWKSSKSVASADDHIRACTQIAQLMQESTKQASHGHFTEAAATIHHAQAFARLEANPTGIMNDVATHLDSEATRLESKVAECQRLTSEMHAALTTENWSTVLSAADALLAIAPQHSAAAQARRCAWKAVGMDVTRMYTGRLPRSPVVTRGRQNARPPWPPFHAPTSRSSEVDTVAGTEKPKRALLWVDAVGGFLVCLDDTIAIGQPSPGESIAVPILADLSRRHAVIRRDAGAYILEPLQRTLSRRPRNHGPTVLTDNQLIQLGDNVRIRFNKPHALSATAKLTLESHHKTQPSADAILLMADSCVLGPNRHCHVRCRNWQRDVVVYRQNDQLFCRADEPLSVDGVQAAGRSEIQSGARVEGEDFSFAWESLA